MLNLHGAMHESACFVTLVKKRAGTQFVARKLRFARGLLERKHIKNRNEVVSEKNDCVPIKGPRQARKGGSGTKQEEGEDAGAYLSFG